MREVGCLQGGVRVRDDVIPMSGGGYGFQRQCRRWLRRCRRARSTPYLVIPKILRRKRRREIGWLKRRYALDAAPEWIMYSPGVVDSIFFCVRSLYRAPGDKILIQPPVYGPFFRAAKLFDRTLVENRLICENGSWQMDFDLLEEAAGGRR